ncbi:phage portal protein [Roseburia intestinalis]|uniref:Phage portal protein n=1 Tax=Roseburia intestinalis TaxID=166486 RepID=A0A413SPG6_9FIRM|nr:terminase small subunit [Roseburia intestinalis]RHA69845.1 phage portal protein [Roseburia intestinalis]
MARSPNEKAEKARKLYKDGMKLVEIASRLDVPPGTVRRWKSTYHWDDKHPSERSEKKSERSESKKNVTKKAVADEVKQVIQNTDLTDKQQLFCVYYIRCFNATKAYQKAYGCGYTTAVTNGPALLGNTRIKEEILRLKQERLNREFLSESDIFQKYMDIAFADVTDFMEFGNEDVDVILDTGEQKTITVSHVNIKNDADVDGTIISEVSKGKDGVKVKLADRMKALQWLSDHMDLATEKQKAEIALLKAKVQTDDGDEVADDGFLDALNGTAAEDWGNEED